MIAIIESSISNLMLIRSYCDNEVKERHRFVGFLQAVQNRKLGLTKISLKNMDEECVNKLISDALHALDVMSCLLTTFIYEKTTSNPYFANHTLITLLEQEIILFCPENSN